MIRLLGNILKILKLISIFVFLAILISCDSQKHTKNIEEYSVVLTSDIRLKMKRSEFHPENHKVTKCGDVYCLIDGDIFFGSFFFMPKYKLESAELIYSGRTVNLDVSGLYEPWYGEHSSDNRGYTLSKITGGHELVACFSDASGSYVVAWQVKQNSSVRTLISTSENVIAGKCW